MRVQVCSHRRRDGKCGGVRIGGGGHTTFCEGMILDDFGWRQGLREEGVETGLVRIDADGESKWEEIFEKVRRWVIQASMGGIQRVVLRRIE